MSIILKIHTFKLKKPLNLYLENQSSTSGCYLLNLLFVKI
ncbi:conserved hypothetical protein [Brochothrix thermosphacta]|uniref:Uncharacterized protein n=1 Tax=Brochothrix thermosphacta TaxID=2756 RepID=A0A2X0SDI2_BROTH|nr:conserved hypothetical protein [Brochothrix thermosphacta]